MGAVAWGSGCIPSNDDMAPQADRTASHAATLLQPYAYTQALGKAAADGPCSWAPAPMGETHVEILAPGCSLAQPWLLLP